MKKSVIILWITLLSVFFYSQITENTGASYSLINTENVVNSSFQIEDNCQEDNFTYNCACSLYITLKEYLSGTLSPHPISGIGPSVWQPPE